jgi:inorganic pyrophosphatase
MIVGNPIAKLPAFYGQSDFVNIVIETPKGAPFKLRYDETTGIFRVHKALPLGLAFPFSFGFLPSTLGGDGDPLDVLLLSDYILPIGSTVLGQLISILEAEQSEGKKKQRNDRLIAIPVELVSRKPMQPMVEFNATLKRSIVDFFVKYNELQGKSFRPLRYAAASTAARIARNSIRSSS